LKQPHGVKAFDNNINALFGYFEPAAATR
jgi:hypothetical protein